jgi:hypothetical protein
MSKDLLRYRHLERRLWITRWLHEGEDSTQEESILDEMEATWLNLSESEQAVLRTEGSRCWPMDPSSTPPQFADARYVAEPTAWAYEGFLSPLHAILSEGA